MMRILLALTLMAIAALPGAAQTPDELSFDPFRPESGFYMYLKFAPDSASIGKWWHAEAVINKQRQVVWNDDWQLEIHYNRRNGRPVKIVDDSYSRLQGVQFVGFTPGRMLSYQAAKSNPHMIRVNYNGSREFFNSYSHYFVVIDMGFAANQRVTVRLFARNTKTGERVRIGKYKARIP
ncbi:MAG: hypothetical protein OXE95_05575 [Chloroflexi bacterium]|nr:hypothetical protein [Chloroflexota bacterium]MCY4247032.1 hypothetical protein [Chloroflexota bacterium]